MYNIATAMEPHMTLRRWLAHPKDNCEISELGELVYKIPCKSCDKPYIGEPVRLFQKRIEEQQKDVNRVPSPMNSSPSVLVRHRRVHITGL